MKATREEIVTSTNSHVRYLLSAKGLSYQQDPTWSHRLSPQKPSLSPWYQLVPRVGQLEVFLEVSLRTSIENNNKERRLVVSWAVLHIVDLSIMKNPSPGKTTYKGKNVNSIFLKISSFFVISIFSYFPYFSILFFTPFNICAILLVSLFMYFTFLFMFFKK